MPEGAVETPSGCFCYLNTRRPAALRALCAFDLDHTLVRSPLDLRAMRAEVRALATVRSIPLPEAAMTWTVAETIARIVHVAPELEALAWAIVRAHETRALEHVSPEPGAREALEALAAADFPLAVWTNNARRVAETALARAGLAGFFSTLVTRDEAALKPDPAGLRLLRAVYPERPVWVIGDSWIDGAAAQAGEAGFIGYGTDPAELGLRAVFPRVILTDLRELPVWLESADGGEGL